jgi:hypothetical protein
MFPTKGYANPCRPRTAELDPRATVGFNANQARTFQIIGPKLDVCAKLLL